MRKLLFALAVPPSPRSAPTHSRSLTFRAVWSASARSWIVCVAMISALVRSRLTGKSA